MIKLTSFVCDYGSQSTKKLRFSEFSFCEIYENSVGKVMVDKMKDLLMKLYNFYYSVHFPNMQEPSGSERTKWNVMLVIHM